MKIYVNDKPLVLYHFHGYLYYANGMHDFGDYRLSQEVIDLLYRPYAKELLGAYAEIYAVDETFRHGWALPQTSWRAWAEHLKRTLWGVSNLYRIV
jgi:hypothetical protein